MKNHFHKSMNLWPLTFCKQWKLSQWSNKETEWGVHWLTAQPSSLCVLISSSSLSSVNPAHSHTAELFCKTTPNTAAHSAAAFNWNMLQQMENIESKVNISKAWCRGDPPRPVSPSPEQQPWGREEDANTYMAVKWLSLLLGLLQVKPIDPQNLSHTLVHVCFQAKIWLFSEMFFEYIH